jgi:hypothetical protein
MRACVVAACLIAGCRVEPTPACLEVMRMYDAGEDGNCATSGIEGDRGPYAPDGACWADAEIAAACDEACAGILSSCLYDGGPR